MNITGLIIGVITFILIGLYHPLVIKGEYYFGTKVWTAFCLSGVVFAAISLFYDGLIGSVIFGVLACCSFWAIKEVFQQEARVIKGWFPMNPERKEHYEKIRKKLKEKEKEFTD